MFFILIFLVIHEIIRVYLKKNLKINVKNYIFELFKILQCKTENEFRKSQLSEPKGEF